MSLGFDRIQFGDFQTPPGLAFRVVELLRDRGLAPRTIVEPTCGTGAFVEAASEGFPDSAVLACDINPEYVHAASLLETRRTVTGRHTFQVANFFERDWTAVLAPLPEPILVLGNPPWATSAGLGAMGSDNLPQKTNFQNRRGLDALTGKSNFDVAEAMLLALLKAGQQRAMTLAMLVKTSVARRVLSHLWATGVPVEAAIYRFDAAAHFGVNADACLFVCQPRPGAAFDCLVSDLERPDVSVGRLGWRDGALVSDPVTYDRLRALISIERATSPFRWRSGVKHDCAAVMELRQTAGGTFVNATGAHIELESDFVYPLLKGTDLVHGRVDRVRRWMLVTQSRPGEDTAVIARRAPRTWEYLCANGARLDARRSSIYRKRPRFSVFGVGPYTFAPWKVAISALHKRLAFAVVGPFHDRPVVLDDTCYHLSFETEDEARATARLLDSEPCRELLAALVFWDAKRPITSDLLQRIDLRQLAIRLGLPLEGAPPALPVPVNLP